MLPLLEPVHLDRDFDYRVPPEMDELAQPGVRVRVRFSGRLIDGFVLERLERSDHTGKIVTLDRVVSGERVLTPEILRLVEAVAARYAGTRADVLRLAIPPRHARTEAEEPKPVELPEIPASFPGWERYAHAGSFLTALRAGRGPRAAWQALPGEDWARRLAELAAVVVAGGRSAVLLVPDQRDLDRVLTECAALVGDAAVGLAAGLGPTARYRRWLAALRGSARVVVGTRSTVFVPARELGLIVIWDDGDDTYAEPRAPYPHAREVAMLRAHETGAAFLAGGFARTAEIQAVVESGWAHDLLAERSTVRQAMPRISAPGDTDTAMERDPIARAVRIPATAFAAARRALAAGDPVLVQVPRRGYIPALACAKCRTPARCRHCNGPLALPDSAPGGQGPRTGSRELGIAAVRTASGETAHSPSCRWCGITEAAFRCGSCGSRALRAVVIGAMRTAEELGRAFPGVPIRGSGGKSVLTSVAEGPQVVVSTIGAEPTVPGGYGVALLLDGWALLGRADLRAAEDALRRWMSAAALVRAGGQVLVMAEPSIPTVQALVRWDPVGHAHFELTGRTEVRFPPAVRFAAVDGTTDTIAELLGDARLPAGVEVLGPVPLPFGARKPFSGDTPADVERMILRVDRSHGAALSRALVAAQAVRSSHRSDGPLRVQIDPIDIG
ncbi:primosomal protein N' [Nocardia sp. CC227C]|uniref:primosomal protein N' n=1 Tax=Nocardia sp. CC227C TaxID=3044562 RepID=UPI00278C574D|nr:primosomal protein N' [Nocardia sp. CC227C]